MWPVWCRERELLRRWESGIVVELWGSVVMDRSHWSVWYIGKAVLCVLFTDCWEIFLFCACSRVSCLLLRNPVVEWGSCGDQTRVWRWLLTHRTSCGAAKVSKGNPGRRIVCEFHSVYNCYFSLCILLLWFWFFNLWAGCEVRSRAQPSALWSQSWPEFNENLSLADMSIFLDFFDNNPFDDHFLRNPFGLSSIFEFLDKQCHVVEDHVEVPAQGVFWSMRKL